MPIITKSIEIDYCLEEVFAFVSKYKNDVKWRKGVIEMRQFPDYSTFAGASTIETIKFLGLKYFISAEIFEYEKNRKVSFRTTDFIFKVSGYREVKSENRKTKFTYSLSIEMTGIYKVFLKLIKHIYEKRIAGDLYKLKQILESE